MPFPIHPTHPYFPRPADHEQGSDRMEAWLAQAGDSAAPLQALLEDDATYRLLQAVFSQSDYLAGSIAKETPWLLQLWEAGPDAMQARLLADMEIHAETIDSKDTLMQLLRRKKRQFALLVALADMAGCWSLQQVTRALSDFADKAVSLTVRYLLTQAERQGMANLVNAACPEENSGIVVLALGKLGGYELNYSSDIDIIVFYDEGRLDYTGKHTVRRFFINLTQELVDILQSRTRDGYVFRVDLRLRPDPGANPVAMSLTAAEHYYETLGQNWERAAMIKARPIIGDQDTIQRFRDFIIPYVWRRALDFASIEDIHSIKRQIDSRQGKLPDNLYGYHVKLGRGGIREIEFFAQTQQLIWGGRRAGLQVAATCDALQRLVEVQELEQEVCDELTAAYEQLRITEHRLQMVNDQQTHSLPEDAEKMQAVALFLGYAGVGEFVASLTGTIMLVQAHYAQLFESSPSLAGDEWGGSLVFTGTDDDPDTAATLAAMGFKNVTAIMATVRGWHHGRYRATRTRRAREILTELMPVLLTALSKTANPDLAFRKLDEFLKKLPSGVQIFSLLYSNPKLLDLIANIMGGYPYIANKLSRFPSLLDYVLAPEFYQQLPSQDILADHLIQALMPAKDMEDVLDITRYWTNDRRFRVGVQWLERSITTETALENLTTIADVVLARLMRAIRVDFEQRHGMIEGSDFAIVGFGKLGGRELTFNSDLDLVFIYDAPDMDAVSDGASPLSVSQYFARLSRRFTTMVNARTPEGTLYDIDLRLRPSGNDGPMATSLEAFRRYYGSAAWKWEYMALTRARVVAGSPEMQARIRRTFNEKLCEGADRLELYNDIMQMHRKTKEGHLTINPFDVKRAAGGLVDLEYIVQYLQLLHAPENPEVLHNSSAGALERLHHAGMLGNGEYGILQEAWLLFSTIQATLRLAHIVTSDEKLMTAGMKRALVYHTYSQDYDTLKKKLVTLQENVQKLFDKYVV